MLNGGGAETLVLTVLTVCACSDMAEAKRAQMPRLTQVFIDFEEREVDPERCRPRPECGEDKSIERVSS
jgi:hypothetical protein